MNIQYLAFIRLPTEKAHGVQIMKTCEALARGGVHIELVVPGRRTHITEDPFHYYGVSPTFTITELNTPDWVWLGRIGYGASLMWFSELVKFRKSFWKADVVYSRDAGVLLQYVLLGRKLVYEAHTKPTLVSRFVARRAYRVIAISEALRDAYILHGVDPSRIVCAHDAVDPHTFMVSESREVVRQKLGIPQGVIVAMYVGRIDSAKGVSALARAAVYLPDAYKVVIIGAGPDRETLVRECPKALFVQETPYRDLPFVLSAADILVAPNSKQDQDAALYTSPLKAYAYLAAKKPIIASDVPSLKAVFGDHVRYVTPDDSDALAQAIRDPLALTAIPNIEPRSWDDRAQEILATLI